MSFKINWNCIDSDSFTQYAKDTINDAMNSGKRPLILSDSIKIMDLNFGSIPPDFEILEIGDLGMDRFRGIFKFDYFGDASVKVTTKVSASLLKNYNASITESLVEQCDNETQSNGQDVADFIRPNFIVSDATFDIPLYLTLSSIKMSSIIVVVYSVTKGLTLVFKNDPLKSIEVNSTFDKITPIAKFLQDEIEKGIGDLFQEFLPTMLYKFSMEYTSSTFDQFHEKMAKEEQEEGEPRVLLKDVETDSFTGISPGSMMRLTRLSSSRQTMALGGELSCDRLNSDIVTKAFAAAILASSNAYSFTKIHLRDTDLEQGSFTENLEAIKGFQTRSFYKSNRDESKPKRRTIKMYAKPEPKSEQPEPVAPVPDQVPVPEVPQATTPVAAEMATSSSTSAEEPASVAMSAVPSQAIADKIHEDAISSSSDDDATLVADGTSTPCPSRSASMSSPRIRSSPMSRKSSSLASTANSRRMSRGASTGSTLTTPQFAQKIYHIGKDEQIKIKKRFVKLDRLLARKFDMDGKSDMPRVGLAQLNTPYTTA